MPQEFYTDGTPSRTVIDEDDAPLNARITGSASDATL